MRYIGEKQLEKMKKIMATIAIAGTLAVGGADIAHGAGINLDNGGRSGDIPHHNANTRVTATKQILPNSPLDAGNWNCIGPNNSGFFIYGGIVNKNPNSMLKVRRPHVSNPAGPKIAIENPNGSVMIPGGSEGPTICYPMKPYKAMESPITTNPKENLIKGRTEQPVETSPNSREAELNNAIQRGGGTVVHVGQPVQKSLKGLYPELIKGTKAQDRKKVNENMNRQQQEQDKKIEEALKGLE
ncbi:MAG: hypothetical protein FWF46_06415 [Oscillospiraceae bacterium]|nr:hypothetical protein [Oscillospiraceae bacterium]